MQKMAELDFDAFLPGHLAISLRNGKRHVDLAAAVSRNLGSHETSSNHRSAHPGAATPPGQERSRA